VNIKSRRSLVVISGALLVLLIAVAAILHTLQTVVRHVAITRLQAMTKRPVTIDRVDVGLLSGRLTFHGLRVAEPDGSTPFADCELLDARLNMLSLVRGHIWVRELVLRKPTLRIVRLDRSFNISDLFEGSETTQKRLDVTVDRFALVDGTVAFEDRALPEHRTWTSRPTTSRPCATTARSSRPRSPPERQTWSRSSSSDSTRFTSRRR
jgi:uncharacterized protein involved in outer membrane biogenesis